MRNYSGAENHFGVGASSLLMTLVILSLTTLGVLSLIAANADLKLTERDAAMTTSYYQAEAVLQRALAGIDEKLADAGAGTDPRASLPDGKLDDAEYRWQTDGTLLVSVDAGAERMLEATLAFDQDTDGRFTIIRHVLVDVQEWGDDENRAQGAQQE